MGSAVLLKNMTELEEASKQGRVPMPSAIFRLAEQSVDVPLGQLSEQLQRQLLAEMVNLAGAMLVESFQSLKEVCNELDRLLQSATTSGS